MSGKVSLLGRCHCSEVNRAMVDGILENISVKMGDHKVAVLRRSGGTFSTISSQNPVRPGEAIRYLATGIAEQLIREPEFIVEDASGKVILDRNAPAGILSGSAWVDTVAPLAQGQYTLKVRAQTYPFLGFTHLASTTFLVSLQAPPPPTAPPRNLGTIGSIFDNLKVVGFIILGIVAISTVSKVLPKGKRDEP